MWQRPKFWQSKFNLISLCLLPFSFIYGIAMFFHLRKKPKRAAIQIICVGNFIAGGAGKTPLVLYLADRLKEKGANPFILTRGYGGKIKNPTRVDSKQHTSADVGDEALMMAHYFPTIVGADRLATATHAKALGADIAILDDGFQNPSLYKDFSLLVVDSYGLGNGRLLPAGPLRERPQTALARAQGVVVVGKAATLPTLPQNALPLFEAEIRPRSQESLPPRLIAFAGLGAPEKFFNTLEQMGRAPLERYAFGDHYVYKEKDAEFLLARAAAQDAALITTEKDSARLTGASKPALAKLAKNLYTLPIVLEIAQEDLLLQKLQELIHEKT